MAAEGLVLLQRIYRIEKVAREAKLTAEQRKQLRDEQARPTWNELRGWLDAKRSHAPPQMLIGMTYPNHQWAQLIRVLDDGRLEVDNNRCENALRPFVLGKILVILGHAGRCRGLSASLWTGRDRKGERLRAVCVSAPRIH